jgi:predicted PurR-regulated permease PerM
VAILIGAALLGVLGALVAIPAAAAVQAVVRDYWRFRQGDRGSDQSAEAHAEAG